MTHLGRLTLHSTRVGMTFALAMLLIAFGTQSASGAILHAEYSCVVKHCYGVNKWSGSTYLGATTDISMVHLNCDPVCASNSDGTDGGFIDNEMWLVDTTSKTCIQNPYGFCWVEVGYINIDYRNKNVGQAYFWADDRPTHPFMYEFFSSVQPNEYGNTSHFVIIEDASTTPVSYQVMIYHDGASPLLVGISNDNPMSVNEIWIGQELFGTGGASATKVLFTENKFATQSLSANQIAYTVQTIAGLVRSDTPPIGQWDSDPASLGDPFSGGQFSTSCC